MKSNRESNGELLFFLILVALPALVADQLLKRWLDPTDEQMPT
jgi:hypothetical protein